MSQKYVVLDTETTGVEPGSRMAELAAIAFNENGVIDQFEQLVNPGMPMPEDASRLNDITDEMLVDKPSAGDVLKQFFDWLPGKTLIAHYAQYDTGIISWEAGRYDIDIPEELMVIDTWKIAKIANETKNNKLITLGEHHKLTRTGDAHRALSDVDMCMQVFQLYMKRNMPGNPVHWADTGHDYSYTEDFPELLSNLPALVAGAKPLTFVYEDAKGNVTDRTITVYGWAMTKTGIMFHGWCHMREARRTFRMDRVKEVKTTEEETAKA